MCDIPYQLLRSRRKTLALQIDREGRLLVRAPLRLSEAKIRAFVREKADWIAAKQQQAQAYHAAHDTWALQDSATLLWFGKPHRLRLEAVPAPLLRDDVLILPLTTTSDDLAHWMQVQFVPFLQERVQLYAHRMGVTPRAVKLSQARRRWGSCSGTNTLHFAWRLVMCPLSCIDYVVVHELAHIPHKDHSPRFWAHVAAFCPQYAQARDWLKTHSYLMEML